MFSRAEIAEPLGSPAKRRWRWLPESYRKRKWVVVGLIALVALALGCIGLTQLPVPSGTTGAKGSIPVPDLLYYVIGLFRFGSLPVDPPYPATLEIAPRSA